MKKRLLIRPTALADEAFYWLLQCGNQLVSQGFYDAPPETSPVEWQAATQVWLLLPAADVAFREVTVMTRKLPPLSWLVEDTVPAQGEELHWALLYRDKTHSALAGCDRRQLLTWIDRLNTYRLQVVRAIPDGLLLPWQSDVLTLYAVEGRWWARFKPHQALCIASPLLDPVLKRLPETHRQYDEQFTDDMAGMLALLSRAVAGSKINMLNGFARAQASSHFLKTIKRATVGLIGAATLLFLLLPLFSAWRDHAARIVSDKQVRDTWHTYMSDAPGKADPGRVFLQRKQVSPHSFHTQIQRLDTLLRNTPALSVRKIDFRQQPWTLKVYLHPASDEALQPLIVASQSVFNFSVSRSTDHVLILTARRQP